MTNTYRSGTGSNAVSGPAWGKTGGAPPVRTLYFFTITHDRGRPLQNYHTCGAPAAPNKPLVARGNARHSCPPMALSDEPQSPINQRAAAYGEALRRLRQEGHVRQAQAALAAGLSQAAWAKYERGRTLAFLNLLNQEKCMRALGRTLADLEAMRATVDGGDARPSPVVAAGAAGAFILTVDDGVHREAESFGFSENESPALFDLLPLLGDGARALKVAGEEMSPYAEPGGFVVYSLKLPPRHNLGVVLKRRDGRLLIRRYVRTTPAHIVCVRMEAASLGGHAAFIEREEQHPVAEVEAVYPIVLRGDSMVS